MSNNSANTKRIAKNTLLLYVRMLVMMFIGLFTSRIILQALGVSDLGLYTVCGGVVSLFSFISGTLAGGTQRFISFGIGEGNIEKLKKTFACAMSLHLLFAVIILIIGETFGLWYLYNKLNVDPGRFDAAFWCYQFSLITAVISVIQTPFNGALIAHEKMDIYAYMTIFEVTVKLVAAYAIMIVPYDRLIFYAALLLGANILSTIIYNWYCRKKFEECAFRFDYEKQIFIEMLSFSGWNTFGTVAAMGQSTGVDLVINFFCGTAVNGARGIASQANGFVNKFVSNFQVALNPQIVKTFASGNIAEMSKIVIRGAEFSSYLLLFLGIPLFIEIEFVLNLWLGQVPEHSVAFMRIVMIESFFRSMANPTVTAMHATGKMKMLNITVGVLLLVIVPESYILFKLGMTPEIVMMVNVIPWILCIPLRLYWLRRYTNNEFPVSHFLSHVVLKGVCLAILMFVFPYYVYDLIQEEGWIRFISVGITSVISSGTIIYFLGLDKNMRVKTMNKVQSSLLKISGKR